MDFQLQQWRDRHESELHPSAKIPKLLETHQEHQQHQLSSESALPLFEPEPSSKISSLSAVPPDATTASTRFSRMGSYFSVAQWQELELQALIFRYMLAGAAVPPELLQPIKKSLLHAPSYFLHHSLQHYQPAFLQSGYWGRAAMDPEPGRCRRTDGKKWRCSRDVVAGQKYCERHMHRGRNRSRKPVEINTSTTAAAVGGNLKPNTAMHAPHLSTVPSASHFDLTGSSSIDLLHLNQRSTEAKGEDKGLFESQNEGNRRSGGHILRPFFDDWPRSLEDSDNMGGGNGNGTATSLSISMPGNSSSDVSLKLSTGNGYEVGGQGNGSKDEEEQQQQLSWAASMGGPLAEALRSSTSNVSPTSVLHQLPRGSASEVSFVCT